MRAFQICYEGDLTLELANAVRRLRGKPNFDSSWIIGAGEHRRAEVLMRYLRPCALEGTVLVARTDYSRTRPFLLVRHSVTEGFDYGPLYDALESTGAALELPMKQTFLLQCDARIDSRSLGARLETLCPYDSLMVVGVAHDFAITSGSGLYEAPEDWMFRSSVRELVEGGEG